MFWHEAGQGPTMVFLHGTWCDGRQWLPLVPQLSRHYHCLAPDLPGWGESTLEAPGSVALVAESLAHWLTALRLPQVYLVAHSVGAWVALHYALRYPHQVRGIVVIDPEGLQPPALAGRWRRDRWLSQAWLPLDVLDRVGLSRRPGPWKHLLDHRRRLQHYPMARRLLFQRRWREVNAEQLDAQLPALAVPTLVLSTQHPPGHQLAQYFEQLTGNSLGTVQPEANDLGLNYRALTATIDQFVMVHGSQPATTSPPPSGNDASPRWVPA